MDSAGLVMDTALIVLGVLNVGELLVIYGLVNRLIRQTGQRPMSVAAAAEDWVNKAAGSTAPVPPKPRIRSGSQRITP